MYFAYGSNMDGMQMARRCPESRLVGHAVLRDHRLLFGWYSPRWGGAVATVARKAGSVVPGMLYEIGRHDLGSLDVYEGHPDVYDRCWRVVSGPGGQQRAIVYCLKNCVFGFPSESYLEVIRSVYRDHGWDESGLNVDGVVRVFVYGTLLFGESNHRLLAGAAFVGRARTEPAFDLVSLGAYPAMLDGGRTAIVGEVYEVDRETLNDLDRLEGHPRFYQRRLIDLGDGCKAFAYLMLNRSAVAGCQRIKSGNWRRVRPASRRTILA